MWKYRRNKPKTPPGVISVDPSSATEPTSPLKSPWSPKVHRPPPRPQQSTLSSPHSPLLIRSLRTPPKRNNLNKPYDLNGNGIRSFPGTAKHRQAGHVPIMMSEDAEYLALPDSPPQSAIRSLSYQRHTRHSMRNKSAHKNTAGDMLGNTSNGNTTTDNNNNKKNKEILEVSSMSTQTTSPSRVTFSAALSSVSPHVNEEKLDRGTTPLRDNKSGPSKHSEVSPNGSKNAQLYPKVLLTELELEHSRGQCGSPYSMQSAESVPNLRQQFGSLLKEWASTSEQLVVNEEKCHDTQEEEKEETDPIPSVGSTAEAQYYKSLVPQEPESTNPEPVPVPDLVVTMPMVRRPSSSSHASTRKSSDRRQDRRGVKDTLRDDDGIVTLLDVAIDWTWDLFGSSKSNRGQRAQTQTDSVRNTVKAVNKQRHGVDVKSKVTMGNAWGNNWQRSRPSSRPSRKSILGLPQRMNLMSKVLSREDEEEGQQDEEDQRQGEKQDSYELFGDSTWEDDEEQIDFVTRLSFDDEDNGDLKMNLAGDEEDGVWSPTARAPPKPDLASIGPPKLELPTFGMDIEHAREIMKKDPKEYALKSIASALTASSSGFGGKSKQSKQPVSPNKPMTKERVIYSPLPSGRLPFMTAKDVTQPEDHLSTDAVKEDDRASDSVQEIVGAPLPSLLNQTKRTSSFLDRYMSQSISPSMSDDLSDICQSILDKADGKDEGSHDDKEEGEKEVKEGDDYVDDDEGEGEYNVDDDMKKALHVPSATSFEFSKTHDDESEPSDDEYETHAEDEETDNDGHTRDHEGDLSYIENTLSNVTDRDHDSSFIKSMGSELRDRDYDSSYVQDMRSELTVRDFYDDEEADNFALTMGMCSTDKEEERAMAKARNPWNFCFTTDTEFMYNFTVFWPSPTAIQDDR